MGFALWRVASFPAAAHVLVPPPANSPGAFCRKPPRQRAVTPAPVSALGSRLSSNAFADASLFVRFQHLILTDGNNVALDLASATRASVLSIRRSLHGGRGKHKHSDSN
jgi:hypothetical protein